MSSPRMNNIIVIGAILIYVAGILLGIDGNFVNPSAEAIIRCRVSIVGYKIVFWKIIKIMELCSFFTLYFW